MILVVIHVRLSVGQFFELSHTTNFDLLVHLYFDFEKRSLVFLHFQMSHIPQ